MHLRSQISIEEVSESAIKRRSSKEIEVELKSAVSLKRILGTIMNSGPRRGDLSVLVRFAFVLPVGRGILCLKLSL